MKKQAAEVVTMHPQQKYSRHINAR